MRALLGLQLHAPVVGGHVEDVALLRIDRTRLLVLAAHSRRAGRDVAANFERRVLAHLDRAAGLHVDLLGPVRRHVFRGAEQRAVGTVEHIGKAVTIEVSESLHVLPIDFHIGEEVLVDPVIVPLIERGHLIGPNRGAVGNVAGEDRHRPLVVEFTGVALFVGLVRATIGRAPQAGVTGRVVDDLRVGVIAVPTPSRAAADLVVLAGEGLDAKILAGLTELRVGLVGVGGQADISIGTRAVANPNLLAVGQVEGRDTTASGELVTAEAYDHLVVGNQRSRRDGLALVRIGILHDPNFFAGLAVKSDDETVEGPVHELAVGIGTATIDGVAASARHSRLVTVGLLHVAPNLLRVVRIGQIESLHHVAVRHGRAAGDHEQHGLAANVLDHERLTLVTAEGVGALQPDHLQLADVVGVDVGQRAVAGQREITAGGWPLVRIRHSCQLLFVRIGERRPGHTYHQRDECAGHETTLKVVHFLLLSLAYSVHRN